MCLYELSSVGALLFYGIRPAVISCMLCYHQWLQARCHQLLHCHYCNQANCCSIARLRSCFIAVSCCITRSCFTVISCYISRSCFILVSCCIIISGFKFFQRFGCVNLVHVAFLRQQDRKSVV